MSKITVTAEAFVTAWQTSSSQAEVAERTGLHPGNVSRRAAAYRKLGVPLKDISRAKKIIDVDVKALSKLAKSLTKD